MSGAGDLNGDGFHDLLVGGYGEDTNGAYAGAAHVVYGGNFTGAVTRVGTEGADTIIGTAEDEIFYAGLADDLLSGGGGADRLSGGAGADTFRIGDVAGEVTILDFDPGEDDILDLSAFGFTDFAQVQALLSPNDPGGNDARLALDSDTVVVLEGLAHGLLGADDVQLSTPLV